MTKQVKAQKNIKKKEDIKEEKKVDTLVKEKVKKERNHNGFNNFIKKVDDNRMSIILFVVGFLISTLLFRCILWPDRIASLADGTQPVANLGTEPITADKLYEIMKEQYSVSLLLDEIDDMILSKKYPENDEMKTEVNNQAEYYYQAYNQYYGYTKEQFLANNFGTEKAFLEYLTLNYRRTKYFDNYVKSLVTDKEIEKYYKDEVFGDVDSKHILVSIKSNDEETGLTDEEAKKLAKEIINKLNSGKSWDEVKEEYKDQIIAEDLGYKAYNASLESSYLKECKNLAVGTYSKTPVLTSYGYHIVYKIDQKDKPKLDVIRDDIIDALANEKKKNDSNLENKALINMRDEEKLEFVDTKLKDEYDKYIKSYK